MRKQNDRLALFQAVREMLGPSLTPGKEDPRQGGPSQEEGAGMVFSALPAWLRGEDQRPASRGRAESTVLGSFQTTCYKGLFYDEPTSV